MTVNTEDWNWSTSRMSLLIEEHGPLKESCEGLSPDDMRTEILNYPVLYETMTTADLLFIDWVELAEYYGYEGDNVVHMPERGKTVEEVAQEVISMGLGTAAAVSRVVEAHQEAIELILNTLDDHASRMERMKKQINTLVEVHGT